MNYIIKLQSKEHKTNNLDASTKKNTHLRLVSVYLLFTYEHQQHRELVLLGTSTSCSPRTRNPNPPNMMLR
jgi:hypothetical protein